MFKLSDISLINFRPCINQPQTQNHKCKRDPLLSFCVILRHISLTKEIVQDLVQGAWSGTKPRRHRRLDHGRNIWLIRTQHRY